MAVTLLSSSRYAIAIALATVAFVATLAHAQPDPNTIRSSLVQVVVMDRNGEPRRLRSGFAISSAGHVITAAHGVTNEDRIVVVPLETKAEMVARVVHLNERADVALLAVNGLEQEPLALAKDGFAPGRLVYSVGVWGEAGQEFLVAQSTDDVPASTAEGAVGQHGEIAAVSGRPAVSLVLHNAMIPAVGYGGPLLNECGEVAGVNRGAPGVPNRRLREGTAPESVVHSAAASAVAGLMLPAGIAFTQSDTTCVEARVAAEARAEEAQAEAEAAATEAEAQAQQAEEAAQQAEEATQQVEEKSAALEVRQQALQEAESRVSDLQEQYDDAVRSGAAEAEALQAELDGARNEREAAQTAVSAMEEELTALRVEREAEAQANRTRFIAIVVAVAFLIAVVVIVAVVVLRRSSRKLESAQQQAARAEQEAEQAQQHAERVQAEANAPPPTVADCLLTGNTDDGQPVSVKIPGTLLASESAVIGRSPRNATFLIDDETLSREHARVSFEADAGLQIEDLNSTNGTRINGRQLQPGTPTRLSNEDVVELGGAKLRVVWEG